MEKKMEVHQSFSDCYSGYEEPYYTNVDRLKRGDLKESFTCSWDASLDPLNEDRSAMPELLSRPNLWPNPDYVPEFRHQVDNYRKACLRLMRELIAVIAECIGEAPDFFEKKSTYPVASIRGLYYPPLEPADVDTTGLGAHTDVQLITMIAQEPYDIQALEVLNANGEWISPSLEPESFVVNLGDMMGVLTNDVFVSTVHRVCNKDKDSRGRYSMPFFFGLNNDELITPLPQFVSEERPLREGYEKGLTGYEHYNRRLQRAHHKHPDAVNNRDPALPKGMTRVNGVLVEGL